MTQTNLLNSHVMLLLMDWIVFSLLSSLMDEGTEPPIAFASRSLTKAERAYSQTDKEALALYWGVVKFHTYL